MRVLASSPLAAVAPGDRIRVRESVIAARVRDKKVFATSLARAELAIFPDGWRQHRDGQGEQGRRPTDPEHQWIGAMHMPRWASRMTLAVERVASGQLQEITAAEARAEGATPLLGGLLWRWPAPIPGVHRGARRAFAHHWDIHHSALGECWADNPAIVVLEFHTETGVVGN